MAATPLYSMARLTPNSLRPCLRDVLSDRPHRGSIRDFVALVHTLAQASIKTSRFHRQSDLGIHSRSDLAMDAVADLFERDTEGRFIHLIRFFNTQNWESLSDRELWTINRKLVAGAVSDSYFRNYRLADPSLARIIRNTKRGVQQSSELELSRLSGQLHVRLVTGEKQGGITWDVTLLTSRLIAATRNSLQTPDILAQIAHLLRSESGHAQYIRLSVLALAIRECSVCMQDDEDRSPLESLLTQDELNKAIEEALQTAYDIKRGFYIEKGKLSDGEFEQLRKSIALRLQNETGLTGLGETNYEAISQFFPGMSNADYRERYRNAFEYLYRLSLTALIAVVEEWLEESAA